MAKLIIKSYQSRGWLVPIIGENFQKITNYCSKNGEYITGIEYRDEYLETGDFEDIDGDYFSSVSFKVE